MLPLVSLPIQIFKNNKLFLHTEHSREKQGDILSPLPKCRVEQDSLHVKAESHRKLRHAICRMTDTNIERALRKKGADNE